VVRQKDTEETQCLKETREKGADRGKTEPSRDRGNTQRERGGAKERGRGRRQRGRHRRRGRGRKQSGINKWIENIEIGGDNDAGEVVKSKKHKEETQRERDIGEEWEENKRNRKEETEGERKRRETGERWR
jgi:hypothetical protein